MSYIICPHCSMKARYFESDDIICKRCGVRFRKKDKVELAEKLIPCPFCGKDVYTCEEGIHVCHSCNKAFYLDYLGEQILHCEINFGNRIKVSPEMKGKICRYCENEVTNCNACFCFLTID